MKIIIGLGNPGERYLQTRHNIGFLSLDSLQQHWNFTAFSLDKKSNSEISGGIFNSEKIILVKPQTFMNESGMAVRKILDYFKANASDILVIQDELDLPIGTFKLATDSGSAGHNGIKSIISHLGTQQFTRLRIGITSPTQDASCLIGAHDFVLQAFTPNEKAILDEQFPKHLIAIEAFITQ